MIRRMTVAVAVLGMAAAACSSGDTIQVEDAWARSSPAVADAAAFYVTLANRTDTEDALVGAESERCGEAQLHESVMDGDVMSMRQVSAVELPAGGTVALEPGGLHIMCLGVTEPLETGETIDVTLRFDVAPDQTAVVAVEDR